MCGIVGLIGTTPLTPEHVDAVRLLSRSIEHRGPDGAGEYQPADGSPFMMAMRRLAIIDLAGGWQPLYNEDQSVALVCNGEVYNYVELRASLAARGHTFRTKSDCEMIVHLYEEFGDDCLHHLRGMYAFALYDVKRRRVLLARDRVGEKPLYIAERPDGNVWFSSELRPLVRSGVVPFQLDREAAWEYFHYGYSPEPRTAVTGVRKLPAGHFMTFDLATGERQQKGYWRMEDAPPIDGDPARVLRAEIDRVFELIVRSDVPIGIALSSGVDSSAIASLTQKSYPGTLHAFTVGFTGSPRQDERAMAKEFCDYAKVPFHSVELSTDDAIRMYPEMIVHRDDPIADLSGVGYLAVMRAGRAAGVPVMIMGHGGDEFFWGYPWVRDAFMRSLAKRDLRAGTGGVGSYLRITKPPRSISLGLRWLRGGGGLLSGYRDYRNDLAAPADRLVFYDHSPEFRVAADRLPTLLQRDFLAFGTSVDLLQRQHVPLPWEHIDAHIARLDAQTYLLENGIAQGDRLSMAASVEGRLPLVDYRLIETAIGLMKANPLKGMPTPKLWLRQALADVIPDFVAKRPKTGFNTPWRAWTPALFEKYGHYLRDGFLQSAGILQPRNDVASYGQDTLAFELWCRQMNGESIAA
jgi:asparagine synthase (glutamine-hydrolysing)